MPRGWETGGIPRRTTTNDALIILKREFASWDDLFCYLIKLAEEDRVERKQKPFNLIGILKGEYDL